MFSSPVFPTYWGFVTLLRGIWYSEVNKQITLICNVGLSLWWMGYRTMCMGIQEDWKSPCKWQGMLVSAGGSSWWSCHSGNFCLGECLTLHCNVLILWHSEVICREDSGLSVVYIFCGALCVLKEGNWWATWKHPCRVKVALVAKWLILEIYRSFPDLFQWVSFDNIT